MYKTHNALLTKPRRQSTLARNVVLLSYFCVGCVLSGFVINSLVTEGAVCCPS